MKKLILTLAFAVIAVGASAQVTLGPRVALISTNLDLREEVANVQAGDAEFGFQYGLFVRVKVPVIGLYVQPELLFSNSASTITSGAQNVDLAFNRVDVPIMIGGKIGPLRINAGPSLSF